MINKILHFILRKLSKNNNLYFYKDRNKQYINSPHNNYVGYFFPIMGLDVVLKLNKDSNKNYRTN